MFSPKNPNNLINSPLYTGKEEFLRHLQFFTILIPCTIYRSMKGLTKLPVFVPIVLKDPSQVLLFLFKMFI